jgi:16S rRNA (guanine527-N7)-methyltransferase
VVEGQRRLSAEEFEAGLGALSPERLPPGCGAALFRHYQELMLWNQRLALMGPEADGVILERHYGEGLAALPLIPRSFRYGLDIGSGAGFPGIVIAAARPGLEMTLAEARERKWSFLATAARKAALPCRCLNVRVASPLPAGIPESLDLVTVRALKLEVAVLADLKRRLSPGGRILLWVGERDPEWPSDLVPAGSLRLAGGLKRRILALRAADPLGRESKHP